MIDNKTMKKLIFIAKICFGIALFPLLEKVNILTPETKKMLQNTFICSKFC